MTFARRLFWLSAAYTLGVLSALGTTCHGIPVHLG